MSGAAQPLLSVQRAEGGLPRQVPVYKPPTTRVWTGVIVNSLGFLGVGGVAVWSWLKGESRLSSGTATVAALLFGGNALLNGWTLWGLKPRMVNLDALDRVQGFVPIAELATTRREIIALLEDLATQIRSNQTSDQTSSHGDVQTSWAKVNRAVAGLIGRGSASASAAAPPVVDRSGVLMTAILEHLRRQNTSLQGQLGVADSDLAVPPERLLPARDDLGEHTRTWNELDLALRTYTHLQVCSAEKQLQGHLARAYEALSGALVPLAKTLEVDLQSCVTGEPEELFGNPALNKSHHALTCALQALGENAGSLSASLKEQRAEVSALGEKVRAAEAARDEASRGLEEARRASSTASDLDGQLVEARAESAEAKRQAEALRGEIGSLTSRAEAAERDAKAKEAQADELEREATSLREQIEPLTSRAEAAERDAKAKEAQVARLEANIGELEAKAEQIPALERQAREAKAESAQRLELYTRAYRGLQAKERELEEAKAAVSRLEDEKEEIGVLLNLAQRTVDAIAGFEGGTATAPTPIEARKLPSHGHPLFQLFSSINDLIRTIERQNSLYDSSSAESTPTASPAKPSKRGGAGGAGASEDDSDQTGEVHDYGS